jgi:hypothetical protein
MNGAKNSSCNVFNLKVNWMAKYITGLQKNLFGKVIIKIGKEGQEEEKSQNAKAELSCTLGQHRLPKLLQQSI